MFTNRYIFIYSSVMVIIVAAVLSSASSLLKPFQEKNIRTEKMMDILKSVQVSGEKSEAEKLYDQYVIREEAINSKGELISVYEGGKLVQGDIRPFEINLKEEQHKLDELKAGKSDVEPAFPLYVCEKDGNKYYVIPMLGKGLWGPIWGNIALEADFNTIFGVTFDHKGETPGLGAEIAYKPFQDQFIGKKLFDDNGNFVSIAVVKGGVKTRPPDKQIHGVDAISGGTITSNGVDAMIKDCLENYIEYIKNHNNS
ncbi:MAG: NADH:ubiquinone reductase (Na(+)-transporting) subunit C [Bacteroidales bacterium]|nr:NADH:ubiquinone reductase (Na(+)-transporting) subunit C [Bacteroidales bacterium]